jgi:hypothetical protein
MLYVVTPIRTRRDGLPNKKDVKDGVISARARTPRAVSGEVAAGQAARPGEQYGGGALSMARFDSEALQSRA